MAVPKVHFIGCYARNNQGPGLWIDAQRRSIYDITISGGAFENNIHPEPNNSRGIFLDPDINSIQDVTITGVRITGQEYGIYAAGSYSYIIVTGNDCRGNSKDGINVSGANVIVANNFE